LATIIERLQQRWRFLLEVRDETDSSAVGLRAFRCRDHVATRTQTKDMSA
jgi:hypothetical protein